ncbi:MAG: hypothetical protein ACRDFS_12965 [Chloroflexota bacterium]
MNRLLVLALSTAGLIISWRSSLQSRRIAGEARQGSGPAGRHFTQTRYARLFGLWNSDLGIAY